MPHVDLEATLVQEIATLGKSCESGWQGLEPGSRDGHGTGSGFPYVLLQEVLGQWAGSQFLDHQVCPLLADTGGTGTQMWTASLSLAWCYPSTPDLL